MHCDFIFRTVQIKLPFSWVKSDKATIAFWFQDYVLLTQHELGCSFHVPANTEVWVKGWEFYKFPPDDQPNYQYEECAQRIEVGSQYS